MRGLMRVACVALFFCYNILLRSSVLTVAFYGGTTALRDSRQGVHTSFLLLRPQMMNQLRALTRLPLLTFLASSPASGSNALASAGISSGLFEVDIPPGVESVKSLGVLSAERRESVSCAQGERNGVTCCLRFLSLCGSGIRFVAEGGGLRVMRSGWRRGAALQGK